MLGGGRPWPPRRAASLGRGWATGAAGRGATGGAGATGVGVDGGGGVGAGAGATASASSSSSSSDSASSSRSTTDGRRRSSSSSSSSSPSGRPRPSPSFSFSFSSGATGLSSSGASFGLARILGVAVGRRGLVVRLRRLVRPARGSRHFHDHRRRRHLDSNHGAHRGSRSGLDRRRRLDLGRHRRGRKALGGDRCGGGPGIAPAGQHVAGIPGLLGARHSLGRHLRRLHLPRGIGQTLTDHSRSERTVGDGRTGGTRTGVAGRTAVARGRAAVARLAVAAGGLKRRNRQDLGLVEDGETHEARRERRAHRQR